MILEIVKYGHEALRQRGRRIEEINDEIRQLAIDMLETMTAANGVGLAAQQVGVPLQLTVIDVAQVEDRPSTMKIDGRHVKIAEHMPLVLINPVLTLGREKEVGVEGCLSFPEMTADILRAAGATVRAVNLAGEQVEFYSTGLLARALQHEIDHLNGILFIDRMNSASKASLAGRLKRLQRESVS